MSFIPGDYCGDEDEIEINFKTELEERQAIEEDYFNDRDE